MNRTLDELILASDELEVVVLPTLGARLHSIKAFGRLVTHSPADHQRHLDEPHSWGGYHMVPWCNRLAPSPVDVAGRTLDLAPNFSDGTAIHGFHVTGTWEPAGGGSFVVEGGGRDGWPWDYTAVVTYEVTGPVLTVSYQLSNVSDGPMPGGVGFHPWFRVPSRVRIPASAVFPDNTSCGADPDPVSGQYDLRNPTPIEPGVDSCWVDLDPATISMWWDDLGIALDYSGSRSDRGPVVAVAAHLPEFGGLAAELQTHAPPGIRRLLHDEPYAIDLLAPGATLQLDLQLTFAKT